MPAFNSGKYIQSAIDSILSQDYPNFELLIYNDASADDTLGIIQKYGDQRIKVYSGESNKGVCFARDYLLMHANGEFIAFLDSDDVCFKTRFSKQIRYLQENLDIHVLGARVKYIDENGKSIFYPFSFEFCAPEDINVNLLFSNTLATSTVIFRSFLKKEIVFSSFSYNIAEDYYVWLSLSKKYNIANLNNHLVSYRIVNSGLMHSNNNKLVLALNRIHEPVFKDLGLPLELLYYHNGFLYEQIKSKIYFLKSILIYKVFFKNFGDNNASLQKVILGNIFRKCLNYSRYDPIRSFQYFFKLTLYFNLFSFKYFVNIVGITVFNFILKKRKKKYE